jgi:CHASE1-domain containing sensor protein
VAIGGRQTPNPKEVSKMKKLLATAIALALALVSMLPAAAAAKLSANHNQTLVRN